MTGPRMNHVEARSSREPARQYVSESHDHKPDAPTRAESRSAAGAREHEPINALISHISIAAGDLMQTSGYMTALWHRRLLNDYGMPSRIADAREAIKRASDALDAYEAAIAKAGGEK